jgi:ketosteroid isomerase-like protein
VSQRLFEAFNRHDADTLAALFAQFPDIHDRIVSVTAQDERVAVEFVSTGCMADAAHCIELPIVSVLTIREGRIVRDVSYFDQ